MLKRVMSERKHSFEKKSRVLPMYDMVQSNRKLLSSWGQRQGSGHIGRLGRWA